VVVAVLEALARDGEIDPSVAVAAARQYKIDDVMAAECRSRTPGAHSPEPWRNPPEKWRSF